MYFNQQQLHSPTTNSSTSGGNMSGSTSPTAIINPSCCDGIGRLITDPLTGQSVCSCSYENRILSSQNSVFNPRNLYTTYNPDQNPYASLENAGVASAFYNPLGGAYSSGLVKAGTGGSSVVDSSGVTPGGPGDVSCWPNPGSLQPSYYSPYDPTFAAAAAYGYGGGYDLAARRKNATRESTATLKAWLNEHKKNPYPTKGEKIMLAIITKMTLTQVSTWFANARRRLKKENKMTWEPKNKTDEDEDEKDLDDDDGDGDNSTSPPPSNNHHHNNNDIKEEKETIIPSSANKPKIWSLADTAACKTPPPSINHTHHHTNNHQPQPPIHHPAVTSSWSFALPYGNHQGPVRYPGIYLNPETDTPPQTPPNLKLGHGLLYSNSENTAFKPVIKGSSNVLSGGTHGVGGPVSLTNSNSSTSSLHPAAAPLHHPPPGFCV